MGKMYDTAAAAYQAGLQSDAFAVPPTNLKWVDGIEYEKALNGHWYATGDHKPGITNTPYRGEPEGSRDRGPITTAHTKSSLLNAAMETVAGRGKSYGRPEDNFARIALHWDTFLTNRYGSTPALTPGDVAIMMALMKIARLENDPKHADSWVDLAGYAACGAEIETANAS